MIDLSNLGNYRENNRIEAKKALGGFPQSVWETYSAFANTLGGIILLGVEEYSDHSLHAVDLPDPDKLLSEFFKTVNCPQKVSRNVLSENCARIEKADGKRIIVIEVPRAQRSERPVYIGGNAFSGTYRRNGEGDYRCGEEAVCAMMRDAEKKSPDMRVLMRFKPSALKKSAVGKYLAELKKPPATAAEKRELLIKYGALAVGGDGKIHPTAAGLLMFGFRRDILKEFPRFALEYKDRVLKRGYVSSLRGRCENIFAFYIKVCEKMCESVKNELRGDGCDVEAVTGALKEALSNTLVNADYCGKRGVVIVRKRRKIIFSNPGAFGIDVGRARAGGVSDPRNQGLVKLFNRIGVGSGEGSGIPNIYAVWERQGWVTPAISESFDPDRITLSLTLDKGAAKKRTAKSNAADLARKAAVIGYLTDRAGATAGELCALLGVKMGRALKLLSDLAAAEIVVRDGEIYRLKR